MSRVGLLVVAALTLTLGATTACSRASSNGGVSASPARGESARSTSSTQTAEPADVELTHHAVIRAGVLGVDGAATLPSGARVFWQVGHDPGGDSEPLVYRDGDAVVKDGCYSFSTRVSKIPYRKLAVWLTFDPGSAGQPANVVQLYGAQGEHLSGSHQNWHGDPSDIEYEFDLAKP